MRPDGDDCLPPSRRKPVRVLGAKVAALCEGNDALAPANAKALTLYPMPQLRRRQLQPNVRSNLER